ncbi:MAG: hypothetical protein C0454_17130 [Parvibaculum sp.]|jgi:hypothetical protein|nr:hypothetical protein [Parvibaculum sp.]
MSNLARAEAGNREGNQLAAARVRALAAAMLMAGLVAGCSSVSDANKPDAMYGGAPSQASTADTVFPDLRSVPQERPAVATPAERQEIAAGLAQDRTEAAQADRDLRSGPVSNSAVSRPSPVAPLQDLPPELEKQSRYHEAPVLPMPESRGGHRDFSKVLPERLMQTAAVNNPAPEVVTEDGAAAAAPSAEPAVDTGPEITPAPTRKVDVKPAVGQP